MLVLSFIREHQDRVIAGLKTRNYPDEELAIVDRIIALDDQRKATQKQLDDLLAEGKQLSKQIGALYKSGQRAEGDQLKAKVAEAKAASGQLQEQLQSVKAELEQTLLTLPNVPHPSVPAGNTDEDNEVYQDWTEAFPELPASALPHWELAKKYQIFDLELGTKLTGSGFPL